MSAAPSKDADEEGKTLGCKHYERACKIKALCCNDFYTCHWCHDEAHSDHKMDRAQTVEVLCMRCGLVQPLGPQCTSVECSQNDDGKFAKYFCYPCRLYESKSRPIYHCDKCGICRVGKGLGVDFNHCDKCGACIAISSNHRCVEGSTKNECPICFEYMFTSREKAMILKCGHAMHQSCYSGYIKQGLFKCPICCKSIGDMSAEWATVDGYLVNEQPDPAYEDVRLLITCNDCEKRSTVRYHYFYHKCGNCGSYNTNVLETVRQAIRAPIPSDSDSASSDPPLPSTSSASTPAQSAEASVEASAEAAVPSSSSGPLTPGSSSFAPTSPPAPEASHQNPSHDHSHEHSGDTTQSPGPLLSSQTSI